MYYKCLIDSNLCSNSNVVSVHKCKIYDLCREYIQIK